MKRNSRSIFLLVLIAAVSGACFGQTKQQRNVAVNGQSGKAEVIDQNGRLFVDVLALASIGNGSVSFSGPNIVLTLPSSEAGRRRPARRSPLLRVRRPRTAPRCHGSL